MAYGEPKLREQAVKAVEVVAAHLGMSVDGFYAQYNKARLIHDSEISNTTELTTALQAKLKEQGIARELLASNGLIIFPSSTIGFLLDLAALSGAAYPFSERPETLEKRARTEVRRNTTQRALRAQTNLDEAMTRADREQQEGFPALAEFMRELRGPKIPLDPADYPTGFQPGDLTPKPRRR